MIRDIPKSALILGLAGLFPFVWGVVTIYSPQAEQLTLDFVGPRFIGPYVGLAYGTVILSFMSGVLWGFATKAVGGGPVSAGMNLIAGFVALLVLDYAFWTWGLAPRWWMTLRVILTSVVVACLLPVVL